MYESLAKFKGTSILRNELEKQKRHLDYRDGTVFTLANVPGQIVVVPVRDTGQQTGSYYVYTKFENKRERGVLMDGKKGGIILREPGEKGSVRISFDAKGNFASAETVGESVKFWDCCSKTIRDSVVMKVFAGPMCAACVTTGFGRRHAQDVLSLWQDLLRIQYIPVITAVQISRGSD